MFWLVLFNILLKKKLKKYLAILEIAEILQEVWWRTDAAIPSATQIAFTMLTLHRVVFFHKASFIQASENWVNCPQLWAIWPLLQWVNFSFWVIKASPYLILQGSCPNVSLTIIEIMNSVSPDYSWVLRSRMCTQ